MTINININVPPDLALGPTGPTTGAGVSPSTEAPSAPTEAVSNAEGDAPWFPAPPVHDDDAGFLGDDGAASDSASSPPGLGELGLDLTADAGDIAPPDVSFVDHAAASGEALPPDVAELGLAYSLSGFDTTDAAPPDPSEFEPTKSTPRRRKAS